MNASREMITEIKRRKLAYPLYAITAEEYSLGRGNSEVVRDMLAGGVKILQYRQKEKSGREKYLECVEIRRMTEIAAATFIVNDDVDIALAVKADGVHLGQSDMPIEAARELVKEDMIIGMSTHSPRQAEDAIARGADYIAIGPIFPTQTKKDVCPAVGLEYLDYAVKNVAIPFVAIGGIKLHNIQEVVAHGASRVAMVTEIVSAPDIRARIKKILSMLNSAAI
ncbi:MAG: thiamine phosphate synthase [Candidatus Omnitrophota bacterium]|nr:thiamine phosphate synthase [Candidatus Omnitrophota bacterium]